MRSCILAATLTVLLMTAGSRGADLPADDSGRIATAERYFRGVYGGDPSVVDDLASDDVFVTYPIFQELFGVPVVRGREAVRDFAAGFAERWTDARFEIHEALADGGRVVLMWGFRARNVETGVDHAWGGITLFRFDESGRIAAEIGEESDPGPMARVSGDED